MKNNPQPPKLFLHFFRWYCKPELRDSIEGDLTELYQERVAIKGKRKADLLFIKDVLLLLRPHIIRTKKDRKQMNQYTMSGNNFAARHFVKIAWRNVVKNKAFSLINIGGLAVGMATAMLIGLWI